MLRKYPNLFADLSAGSGLTAISRDRKFGKKFLAEFQNKLIFGRDNFNSLLMDYLKSLNLSKTAFEKITYKNALKLLGECAD